MLLTLFKQHIFQQNVVFFKSLRLYTRIRKLRIALFAKYISAACAKLENFEPKISLCVQLAVLSG